MNHLVDSDTSDLFDIDYQVVHHEPFGAIKNKSRVLGELAATPQEYDLRFQLKNEAWMLKLAYANNKLLSLSNSRTKILAHQVESTYIVVNTLNQRYILADEVGLGKTVEAGLVIKELVYRFNYRRILVAAPASLIVQWQQEMDEKFGEHFDILDRKLLDKTRRENPGKNPWTCFEKVVCSLDFIKNPKFTEELEQTQWDAIIFDEAHRLRRDANTTTILYSAAEMLSQRTKALLLLTATPFRGKLEELYFTVRLVDPNLLGPIHSFQTEFCSPDADLSRLKDKLSTILLRRTKNEIGGFTKRHARTIRFELYPDERELYEYTSLYVAEEFNRAMMTENRAVGFIMCVFQKLLDSSSYALACALKNRRVTLQQKLDRANGVLKAYENYEDEFYDCLQDDEDIEDIEELTDDMVQKTAEELKEELKTLERLIEMADKITRNKKGERLLKMIRSLKKEGHTKFLIFTQFRTTQDYIADLLKEFKVAVFNGSMDKDAKEQAIIDFKGDTEVLICTEAGGEGRNMQFCSILFNYDLPWSPLKIEQRIGRLHRFGQKYDVMIYNFATKDTVAERILDVLEHKLHLFRESIGPPDIMLGQIEDELSLSSLFMKIRSSRKKKAEELLELDHAIGRAKKSFEKLSSLTLTKQMDFNYDEYYKITQTERKFSNEQLENFIMRYALLKGESTISYNSKTKTHSFTDAEGNRKTGTFDSDEALSNSTLEFLAIGHPLVDQAINECIDDNLGGFTSVKVIKGDIQTEGILYTFKVNFRSVSQSSEFIPVFSTFDSKVSEFEKEEIEESAVLKEHLASEEALAEPLMSRLAPYADELFTLAVDRLRKKISDKIFDMKENLELQMDPEIEKINESYAKLTDELKESLSRQELRMQSEEVDMRSAITRTKNRIAQAEEERRHLIAKCERTSGIRFEIELLSGAFLITAAGE